MARILCYTSPGLGHLYPTVPILVELSLRGHQVIVQTVAAEVARMNGLGLSARAIAPAIEALPADDWTARSPVAALQRAVAAFTARAPHEVTDLDATIAAERPDLILIDFNCWGAAARAEQSGIPWALFMPYFLPWRLPGIPPFGPGLLPRNDLVGRIRDRLVRAVVHSAVNRNLPSLNRVRASVGLAPLTDMADQGRAAPCLLYYTAEPFEYPCAARPPSVKMIGPGAWEPDAAAPEWLASINRPIILVTCSTEFQDDSRIIATALEALAGEDYFVIATSAAIDPVKFPSVKNARVERFLPHRAILARASGVICHGGMGITQKALAAGVPVCVVPFGRDQREVAAHVRLAGAGVSVASNKLRPDRLRAAVKQLASCRSAAEKVAEGFRRAGGAPAGADALERLLPSVSASRAAAH
jgi:MGT family glycosyltransferase